jgi:3-hydroxy acid dehydrogenase/malonic semialdehyde reductase
MISKPKPLALITGASAGIGRATAVTLASLGYDLLLLARRTERLQHLKTEIAKDFPSVTIFLYTCDVSSKPDIETLIQQHGNELQHLDLIVNNAGLAKGVDHFQNASLDDFDQMLNTNIRGLIYCTRLLLPFLLKRQGGQIVNIGSVAGRWVYPGGAVYCASKFAVRALTEGLRQDLCGTGLRVTNIEPGMVESEFSVVRLGDPKKADAVYQGMTPLSPKDIADTIAWCVSRPKHVNIQEIVIFPTDQAAIRQVHRQET